MNKLLRQFSADEFEELINAMKVGAKKPEDLEGPINISSLKESIAENSIATIIANFEMIYDQMAGNNTIMKNYIERRKVLEKERSMELAATTLAANNSNAKEQIQKLKEASQKLTKAIKTMQNQSSDSGGIGSVMGLMGVGGIGAAARVAAPFIAGAAAAGAAGYGAYQTYESFAGGGSSIGGSMGSLLDFIAKGEGGYNSMNQGTRGNKIVGSTHDARSILGKDLTQMSVGEIMSKQNSGQLFAAGRYQIIPSTMRFIVDKMGISKDALFSPGMQDKMGIGLIQYKRPKAWAFISGKNNDLQGAMLDLAMEWASLPDPRTGRSFYGGANKSSASIEQVKGALIGARGMTAELGSNPLITEMQSTSKEGMFRSVAPGMTRMSDSFGARGGRHKGIDLAGEPGSDIKAMAAGKVIRADGKDKDGYGNRIEIDHGNGKVTTYSHLYSIQVRVGQMVDKGTLIGTMGSTGKSTGSHLHFEVKERGKFIDPTKELAEHVFVQPVIVRKENERKQARLPAPLQRQQTRRSPGTRSAGASVDEFYRLTGRRN